MLFQTSIPLFHNVRVNYTNVDEATLLFEKTLFDGQELIIIGKNAEDCTSPNIDEGKFTLGDKKLTYVEPIYSDECYFGIKPAGYTFQPPNELSSDRNSNTQTSLGQVQYY